MGSIKQMTGKLKKRKKKKTLGRRQRLVSSEGVRERERERQRNRV